jgi:predicted TPR repeat methyltransferase
MSEQLLQDAQSLHKAGKLMEAARRYEQFLQLNPTHFAALYGLGLLQFQGGQFDKAQVLLGEATRLNPCSSNAPCVHGMALLKLQRHKEALVCFDRALAIKPDFVDALSNRATALLEMNRLEEALADFDGVLAIAPNHAISWNNRANTLVALRRFENAVQSYDRALNIVPDFTAASNNRKYALGMVYFERGQFEQAQCLFDEAVRLNPLLLDGLCVRGIALMRLGRHEEAIVCFDRALAIKPDFVEALSNRATALLEMNRLDEALAGFDGVLDIDSAHANSWNNRGNVLMGMKCFEDALASYDRALVIRPDFPESHDNRANALFALRRMGRCPPAFVRALFDGYSSYYDASMVEALGYRGHLHLRSLAERILPRLTAPWRILDLGSGTGLVGDAFKDLARGGRLDGIDISPRMIEAARQRGIYDDLILGDLESVLAERGRSYDLILAADTMVYFGDLAPTFAGVTGRLEVGGFYLFAVESMTGDGWEQMPVNRFRHSETYLRAEAARAGLKFVDIMPCLLRREKSEPVAGFAVALQKAARGERPSAIP